MRQLGERVRAACEDLVADAIERTVVVTSHVSPIKVAVAWALGAAPVDLVALLPRSGGDCRIMCTADGPMLVGFNERSL